MADQDLTQLTETTSVADDALVYIVTDPTGVPVDRKITGANLKTALGVGGVDSGYGETLVRETFNRPNATGGLGTTDSGHVWANDVDTATYPHWNIVNGLARPSATSGISFPGTTCRAWLDVPELTLPVTMMANTGFYEWVQFDILSTGSQNDTYIMFAYQDADNHYIVSQGHTDARWIRVYQRLAGVTTVVYEAGIGAALHRYTPVRVQVVMRALTRFGSNIFEIDCQFLGPGITPAKSSHSASGDDALMFRGASGRFGFQGNGVATINSILVSRGGAAP